VKKSLCIGCFASSLLAFCSASSSVAHAQCLDWKPGFGVPGGGVSGVGITAEAVYDDGSGPALYVAGLFDHAGTVAVSNIAKWNGSSWSALENGVSGGQNGATSLAVFDDGTGPALYVGGLFTTADAAGTTGIARWNGAGWSSVGGGVDGSVRALAVHDDGSGPALYVAGQFGHAGNVLVNNIAKWNGSTWSALGSGSNLVIRALASCDVGGGAKLFASGDFGLIGGVYAQYIAQWDGTSWSTLGGGMIDGVPYALCAFNDGTGNALYAAGSIMNGGPTPFNSIAKWNGSNWSALGSGLEPTTPTPAVFTLHVFDDGSGAALYAGGFFTTAGGHSANRIAKWNGSAWSALAGGTSGPVGALVGFNAGDGLRLYAGGSFGAADTVSTSNIAKWGNGTWSALDPTPKNGFNGSLQALCVFDDGTGPTLYAGGTFDAAGTAVASNIAKWNGSSWSALGAGVNHAVLALIVFDDGSGPALFAAGQFTLAGGQPAARVAKWNGATWSPLGAGLSASVWSLGVFDAGHGPALYAGGEFTQSGGASVTRIAKWNGTIWSTVGLGSPDKIESMVVFDDGSGPALYVGGQFSSIGGQNRILHIARWNGAIWTGLDGGLGYDSSSEDVNGLAVFDDGSGPALIAVGSFAFAGGAPAAGAAKWNGTAWSTFGSLGIGESLAQFDDGAGNALYAGINDGSAGGGIAKWSGSQWSLVGGGVSGGGVGPLAVFDDHTGGGPDLYAGGDFIFAGSTPSASIAEWRGCAGPGTLYCFGDTPACPCGNLGAPEHGCNNSAATGGALLASAGHTSPDTVVLASIHELPSALSIFLQGNATISPVPFGDGLRCAGGSLKRLYVKNASGGVVVAPSPGDPSITTRSAELGDTITPGSVRYYQTYYRDPSMTFCPAPTGNTWNVSNGVRIQW
jgi:hypothetical protein